MREFLIICLFVLMFSSSIFADIIIFSTEEMVEKSDFIVIGTLQSVSDIYENDPNLGRIRTSEGQGFLVIDRVVEGNILGRDRLAVKSGYKLNLGWGEPSMCLSGWHRRNENKKGVWFLNLDKDGAIQTNHPAQFASLDDLSEIEKHTKNYEQKFSKVFLVNDEVNQNTDLGTKYNFKNRTILTEVFPLQKTTNYSPFSAFLVIFASISLYYLLYRSKFKIR